ncbi:hypothetical protein RHMOL_Rhmol10G0279600 [Rhododendron molle]|uniref:Uncharacterized protein n=1 Tax=Rhododendron molle TaxID=49168 RepID=A0ACC0M8S0_RHOML|nr:hypothetical protein RHMOL_Rhmol10G0279600 [Rhododendron molle]
MSCGSTNHRGDDGDYPNGPLYDPTTPNCDCGIQLEGVDSLGGVCPYQETLKLIRPTVPM